MNWLRIVNGASTYYIPIERIDRMIVGASMTIYVNGGTITQFPIAAWNAGDLLDPVTFAIVGPNPMQV